MRHFLSCSFKSKSLHKYRFPATTVHPTISPSRSPTASEIQPHRRFLSSLTVTSFGKQTDHSSFLRIRCSPSDGGASRGFCSRETVPRDSLSYDVVIVGAGPAGLSAAIRLKQLCRERDTDISVCVLEKGAEIGAHILSGNVFEPRALDELLPNWKRDGAPIEVPVSLDKFWFLTKNLAVPLPSPFDNKGNYVISLSQLVRWLAAEAEELGVEIYSGFAASEIIGLLESQLAIWVLLEMVAKERHFNLVLS